LVAPERICTIVAQQHRQWWSEIQLLSRLPSRNLIVQPRNRGTAIGILYALLRILARDPKAIVVLLPSDHYVRDEPVLYQSLRLALQRVEQGTDRPVLLGLEPDETDADLGYILPSGPDPAGGQTVAKFIEKPSIEVAHDLIERGGLWNAFIIVASGQALLSLFMPQYSSTLVEMQVILSRAQRLKFPAAGWPALVDLYARLPELDFSRDILEGKESKLCVMRVPPCGWSDLGTPRRVAQTLQRLNVADDLLPSSSSSYLNLAAQHAQFARSSQLGSPLASG
jgi:mannose-1-phosphate guanylyltransferase